MRLNPTYRKLLILLAAIGVVLILFWALDSEAFYYYTFATIILITILLWVGNRMISKLMDQYMPWVAYGRKRFFVHLFLGILFSVGILNLAYLIVKGLFTDFLPTTEQLIVMNVYGSIVVIPIFSIYFSLYFLSHWQESELEMERFQRESMTSQLQTLKNHLDPHFLFNNLNILSALIDKDTHQSQEFLDRFAQVYRTMLLTKAEDLVTVGEEMAFIETYIYLIQTRFEENIQFCVDLDEEAYMYMLPPLTIQMLIENAVKHNSITPTKPLTIRIFRDDLWLTVENNINQKPEDLKTKSGTGLKNIAARYQYYSDQEVRLERNGTKFVARLPLLEIEEL